MDGSLLPLCTGRTMYRPPSHVRAGADVSRQLTRTCRRYKVLYQELPKVAIISADKHWSILGAYEAR